MSEQIRQTEAVFQAVKLILNKYDKKIDHKKPVVLSDYETECVVELLASAAMSGLIQFTVSAQIKHLKSVKTAISYLRCLLKNNLLKDRRLNGGVVYTPKRTLNRDIVLKQLRFLKKEAKVIGDDFLIDRICTAIDVRKKELV